jgi:hypothetical protein
LIGPLFASQEKHDMALVTGDASGIGRATALAMARAWPTSSKRTRLKVRE